MKSLQRLLATASLVLLLTCGLLQAQPLNDPKPYKVLTSGRQLIIKSTKAIQHVMLWTTTGDRVVEQRGVNNTSFTIDVPVNKKAFFLMVGLANGKVYTEKIGMP